MERRNFLKAATVAGLSSTFLTSTAAMENNKKDPGHVVSAGTIVHSVYFWLKEGITAEEEQDFLLFFQELRKVPTVHTLQYGKPAPTNARDVVDNSFQYNLLVTFHNIEDINTYETHPIHLAAAEKFSKYWTRVQVRDMLVAFP